MIRPSIVMAILPTMLHDAIGHRNGLNRVQEGLADGRGRDEDFSSPTGSPEAVARPRLPQNVACGFTAPRSSAVGSQLSLLSVQVSFPWSADLLFEKKAVTPVEWSPCRPRTIQLPLTASPCGRLSRPRSTISQSDFHLVIRPFSPRRLGRSYKLALEPDGSPLFALLPLVACWRYEPPGASQAARYGAGCDSAFPFTG